MGTMTTIVHQIYVARSQSNVRSSVKTAGHARVFQTPRDSQMKM